jgi:hypothetical protein
LLFWKNDDAGYSNRKPPTDSRIIALCDVIQTCLLSASERYASTSASTESGLRSGGRVIEGSRESRRMSDTPRLNVYAFLED